jgi:hypothetical protein
MDMRKLVALFAVIALALLMACGGESAEDQSDAEETGAEQEVPAVQDETDQPGMTDEEKMAYVMENCICPQCPSWIPEAGEKGEGGYCATGASECIVVEAGCVCPQCPVTSELGLEWGYYCTRGSAAEMMAAETAEGEAEPE